MLGMIRIGTKVKMVKMRMFNFFSRKNFNQICNEKVNRLSDLNHRNGYKIFTSVKEIKSWTNSYFPDFYQMEYKETFNYDMSIRKAVYAYVGNCHIAVNEYLRHHSRSCMDLVFGCSGARSGNYSSSPA